ncbi:MAG: diguanylate cyclase [Desulfobacterales bacterium]|nr:diguanylate cyclase [Desulfobacterales bacterium]
MSLKTKFAVILVLLSITYVAAVASIQFFLIYPNFLALEKKEAVANVERIVESIYSEIDHLDKFCHDWSAWNDTYEFAVSGSVGYIESNLSPDTFVSGKVNLIHIVNTDRELVWGKTYNTDTKEEMFIKEFSPESHKKGHGVFAYTGMEPPFAGIKKNGIIITEKGPMLFAARPILKSDHQGPVRGNILMARFIDASLLNQLRKQTHVEFIIQEYRKQKIITFPDRVRDMLSGQASTLEIKGRNNWTLYRKLPGLAEGSGLLLQTYFPRDITGKARASMRFSLVSLGIASLVVLVITLLVIDKTIVTPLVHLTRHTRNIRKDRVFLTDIEMNREDEIGSLGKNFNGMLSKIRSQTDELIAANLKLSKLSGLDGLTGIPNRRTFDEKIRVEWKKSLRENTSLSLILCDIDFFKRYNDSLGHLTGDRCLKLVAAGIQDVVHRPADLVARYGGEEFGIILSDTDQDGAVIVAERIRKAVETLGFTHPDSSVADVVTLSLGVSTMAASGGKDVSELITAADKALYEAKTHGRNCIKVQ